MHKYGFDLLCPGVQEEVRNIIKNEVISILLCSLILAIEQ